MQLDDNDKGGPESRPDGSSADPNRTPDPDATAGSGDATPDATAGSGDPTPQSSAGTEPALTPPPSPWQPIQPNAWGAGKGQPLWGPAAQGSGQPQWGAPAPAPSPAPAPAQWPPVPQSWQPSTWPPKPTWGAPASSAAPRRASRLPAIITVVAACLLAFSGGLLTDHFGFAASPTGSGTDASAQSDALYNEAVQIVKQNFVGRASLTDQQLTYGSITGLVDSLGDTGHSEFMSASQYAAMESSLNTSSIAGIGVILTDDNGAFRVSRVLAGTPAATAGIVSGDQITAVDGTSTANITFDQLASMIRGDAGTKVTLTVIHLGSTTPTDVSMTRAKITVPLADWGMIPGTHIADISLAEFSTGAADQVAADITSAKVAGASSIVLDLRGNPGGYAEEARQVASEFLSSGTVYIQQDAQGNDTNYSVDDKRIHTDLPLVVLVDHDSASSSEIVTGALQDSGRAKIVGVNTFGTGTVLEPFKLSDGSVIILGTEWWLTPNGHRIFGVGITPDQKVALQGTATPIDPANLDTMTAAQFNASADAQLLAAVADLAH
jgi:carboxyl-terminal processing protease